MYPDLTETGAPFLMMGDKLDRRLALKQLSITLQHEIGPWGSPVQGTDSLPNPGTGLGKAIIQESNWDRAILDDVDVYSILVFKKKKHESILFIPNIFVQDLKKAGSVPSNMYQINFRFDCEAIFISDVEIKPQRGKDISRRAEAIIEDL